MGIMKIRNHMATIFGSFVVGAGIGVVLLFVSALSFQLYRTCHGRNCLDEFKMADGSYQIPGLACFHPISFYRSSEYEKFPNVARHYFINLYGFAGDMLVIYLTDQ